MRIKYCHEFNARCARFSRITDDTKRLPLLISRTGTTFQLGRHRVRCSGGKRRYRDGSQPQHPKVRLVWYLTLFVYDVVINSATTVVGDCEDNRSTVVAVLVVLASDYYKEAEVHISYPVTPVLFAEVSSALKMPTT